LIRIISCEYDELTGLQSREYSFKIFEKAIKKSAFIHSKLTYVLIDIDFLFLVTYTFGYAESDKYLTLIAKTIENTVTVKAEFIARVGGDEFGILFMDIDDITVQKECEKIKNAIKNLKLLDGKTKNIDKTISSELFKKIWDKGDFITISIAIFSKIAHEDDTPDLFFAESAELLESIKLSSGYDSMVSNF